MSDVLGLDFGTTNTVMALPAGERARAVALDIAGERLATLRTALCFWRDAMGIGVEAGPFAIEKFIDDPEEVRFIQSFKTFAASPHFPGTYIFGKRYTFEALLETFLARTFDHAKADLPQLPRRVVVGRPVAFAGADPDAALARQRYESALRALGFEEIVHIYEPVAAAFFFARALTRPATILVADFGGGTTDFSIMRFGREGGALRAHALGHGGVGIAGDQFDYRIVNHAVLPRLGKGTKFRGLFKDEDFPDSWFNAFSRWNSLSILKASNEFREMKKLLPRARAPEMIERFISLVEEDQGYPLYRAISGVKMQLSQEERAVLRFAPLGDDFSVRITRTDFEDWIAEDLARIERALGDTLDASGLGAGDIDQVFLTGGTSFVPAVRALFARRFGAAKINSGDELVSIATGLALIGAREDYAQWAA
jgi:hypothetical chaperone protein